MPKRSGQRPAYALFALVTAAASVGLLVPKMQTVAMTQFPPGQKATAMGIAGIALGLAPNVGPTVGGAMDSAFGWRSFFLLMLVLSALLIVLAVPLVKGGPQRDGSADVDDTDARFEGPSFILSTLGFGGVLLGFSQASSFGFASAWVWVPIAFGAACLVLFVRRQRAVENPLMDLRIFGSRQFVAGLVAAGFLFASYMGVTLVLPLYVQDILGGTSLDAGLIMLPSMFTAIIVNPLSGLLADRKSARLSSLVFAGFLVAGSVAAVVIDEHTPLWLLAVYQTTRAIGVSGLVGPLVTYALAGLEGPLVTHGSTTAVITRQVAATFGTALMVFCVTATASLVGDSSVLPYQVSFGFAAVLALACLATIIARVRD